MAENENLDLYCIEDPNNVNLNPNQINGIPHYEDMHIFAELTAIRKGRSVITVGEGIETDNIFRVNFIGNNQNVGKKNQGEVFISNPDYLNFTTNYYDGSTNNETQFESFGISSIKITISSSFVPQITIQFVDLRGLSFFNQEDSPYRILFDFPPPTFNLKIKGYYGSTLEYNLHLVKYNTEFKSGNGSFVIDADFVAMTFAPLSDLLFRYIVNTPLIGKNIASISSDTGVPPNNTFDLILKLKNLYTRINEEVDSTKENKELESISIKLENNKSAIEMLENFSTYLTGSAGNPLIFINDVTKSKNTPVAVSSTGNTSTAQPMINWLDDSASTQGYQSTSLETNSVISKLKNIHDYDDIIESYASNTKPTEINKKLCLGYVFVGSKQNVQTEGLETYREQLLKGPAREGTNGNIDKTDISTHNYLINQLDISLDIPKLNNVDTYYVYIDITDFYFKLYRANVDLNNKEKSLSNIINTLINNAIVNYLGMTPTIYNVFKLILDDVDTFFNVLRKTSEDAEKHHNIFKKEISEYADYRDVPENVYSFPLVITYEKNNINKQVRIAPIELSKTLNEPFPELDLVSKFIDTFTDQKEVERIDSLKLDKNDDGTNKWIPISPIDSASYGKNAQSPYTKANNVNDIFNILLNRFYILSQYSIPDNFYGNNVDIYKAYINMYAKAEALNLSISISTLNDDKLNNLKFHVDNYIKPDIFYSSIESGKIIVPVYTDDSMKVINDAYIDYDDVNYEGLNIFNGDVITQVSSSDIFKDFTKTVEKEDGWWNALISFKLPEDKLPEESFKFTDDNIIYVGDSDGDSTKSGIMYDSTRCLSNVNAMKKFIENQKIFDANKYKSIVSILLEKGNNAFTNAEGSNTTITDFRNIIDVWIKTLSDDDKDYYKNAFTNADDLCAVLLLSNLGLTISPYNVFPYTLNKLLFSNPAIFQVPSYLPLYIGALVDADKNGLSDELTKFYSQFKEYKCNSLYTFADIHDINTYLSQKDKEMFVVEYNIFKESIFENIHEELNNLFVSAKDLMDKGSSREDTFTTLLKKSGGSETPSYYEAIFKDLITKTHLVVYSENTFNLSKNVNKKTYDSLKKVNKDKLKKERNDKFFQELFVNLKSELGKIKNERIKSLVEQKKISGDDDIISQTYYSFKTINDKWLTNPTKKNGEIKGYPYNEPDKTLIDSFAFVDRTMNPIGDTIINPEILINMFEDTNVSVFTVLAQLLSMNNFEFFPLQNFMTHSRESWENTFKINVGVPVSQRSTFVCMYIGGSSSLPTNIRGNGFKNDGIEDIQTTDAPDFKTSNNIEDVQTVNNTNFPYKQVRAFRVGFGQQNQSMFKDIKIDSKEYPETNESLQILARLAGDQRNNAPVAKAQNLYNVFENRAYQATITGLGNAMIQPTQYFQLDNIPIFNGAYLITSVKHDITANNMLTTFSGTKILKYPVPRILDPAAVLGFDGGHSDATNKSSNDVRTGANAETIQNNKAKYNSMYNTYIQ